MGFAFFFFLGFRSDRSVSCSLSAMCFPLLGYLQRKLTCEGEANDFQGVAGFEHLLKNLPFANVGLLWSQSSREIWCDLNRGKLLRGLARCNAECHLASLQEALFVCDGTHCCLCFGLDF